MDYINPGALPHKWTTYKSRGLAPQMDYINPGALPHKWTTYKPRGLVPIEYSTHQITEKIWMSGMLTYTRHNTTRGWLLMGVTKNLSDKCDHCNENLNFLQHFQETVIAGQQ